MLGKRVLLHVVVPIVLGMFIYLFYRSTGLLYVSVIGDTGRELLTSLRSLSEGTTLPKWVVFSLPNALWVYALTSVTLLLLAKSEWKDQAALGIGLIGGAGMEMGQLIGMVPGTFSSTDLGFCLVAVAASLFLVTEQRNHTEAHTRPVALLASFLVLGLLAAGSFSNDKEEDKKVEGAKAEVSVSASTLYSEYESNEVAADNKYKDKVIEVSGQVEDIGKDITDSMYLKLGSGEKRSIGGVQAFFSDKYSDQLAKIQKGANVTLKCKCNGKMGNVLLKNCMFEK